MAETVPARRRSALEAAACLHRYNELYNKGVVDQSQFALRGTGFHACAHAYIKRLVAKHLPADAEEAAAAFQEGIASALTPANLVNEVRDIWDRFAEHFELDLDAFLYSEERQQVDEETFTPDLVYARADELEIIDWKTFFVGLTEDQAKKNYQARMYIGNAMKLWPGFKTYRFTFAFVRLNRFASAVFDATDAERVDRENAAIVATLTQAAHRGEWPAAAGAHCAYCSLECPLETPAMIPARLVTQQQVLDVASELIAGAQRTKALLAALKAYCSVNGPVDLKGVVYAHREQISRSYPADPLFDVLRSRVIAAEFSVSASALKKLVKNHPTLESDLAALAVEKPRWVFKAKKATDEDEDDE
jgi:hypothetical protein